MSLHDLDERVASAMLAYARHVDDWDPWDAFPLDLELHPGGAMLFVPWSLYEYAPPSGRIADQFTFEGRQAAWVTAQKATRLGVWEVIDVEHGTSLRLREVFTGEERDVVEHRASRIVTTHEVMLARVVDFEGTSVVMGMHPRPLPRSEVMFLERASATALIEAWEARLAADPAEPVLHPEGDELVLVEDTFTVEGPIEPVRHCILALPDACEDAGGIAIGEGAHVAFASDLLYVSTNSRERATSLLRDIERACGALVAYASRRERPAASLVRERRSGRPPVLRMPLRAGEPHASSTAEEEIQALKARHYARWCDEPSPALGGSTPRKVAASGDARLRMELDILLREIELRESAYAPAERFDVAALRDELS